MSSFKLNHNEQDDTKFDDVQQKRIFSGYPSSPINILSSDEQVDGPECLSKNFLSNMLSRNRRASISRPYFHHWRASRDSRYALKNLLAFSPRLGKRAYEDVNEFAKRQSGSIEEEEDNNNSSDLDKFLITFLGHLQSKKIDIIYEDSNKICLSKAITDDFMKEFMEKFNNNRREQEAREQLSKSKHPLVSRYRLG
jgi:hypothetical protein